MSSYKVIFFDLDGTAIPNSRVGMPSHRLIASIKQHRDHLQFVATTARPPILANPVIAALGLTDPCIISGGTVIIDPVTGSILRRTLLSPAIVQTALKIIHAYGYEANIRETSINQVHAAQNPGVHHDVDIIFVAGVSRADTAKLKHELEMLPDIAANFTVDWSGQNFVFHITHKDATKEHAVTDVLQRLGLSRSAAIGVGDGQNDLHLFAAVALKVAMGNADPALKAAADIIAPSVDEDGLAQIIEQYGQ